jgi:aminoglycoside phosphotransferase (APT) family kinase protein
MTEQSAGELIGSGRSADVYEHEPGWVLRRYREPRDTEREVAGMEHARAHGFPAPEARALSDTEIVMRRLEGPTMLDDLGRRPWMIGRHAATLATLHRRLHEIEAPDWLPTPLGEGKAMLHLDLHPDNVILTSTGPGLIDWTNVARGPGAADVAYTSIVLTTAGAPRDDLRTRVTTNVGRRLFLRAFLGNFDRAERGEAEALVPIGAAVRLEDRVVPPEEHAKIARLARPNGLDV